jgi:hypothetical protein
VLRGLGLDDLFAHAPILLNHKRQIGLAKTLLNTQSFGLAIASQERQDGQCRDANEDVQFFFHSLLFSWNTRSSHIEIASKNIQ